MIWLVAALLLAGAIGASVGHAIGYWRGQRDGGARCAISLGTVVAERLLAHGIDPRIATGQCGCNGPHAAAPTRLVHHLNQMEGR